MQKRVVDQLLQLRTGGHPKLRELTVVLRLGCNVSCLRAAEGRVVLFVQVLGDGTKPRAFGRGALHLLVQLQGLRHLLPP